MGKNELKELRKQAEQAIANTHRVAAIGSPTVIGHAAIAKTIMYVGELLADRLDTPRVDPLWPPTLPPICTDGDCSDTQYHADHSTPADINAEMMETLEWIIGDDWNDGIGSWAHVRDRIEATIANAKGDVEHGR